MDIIEFGELEEAIVLQGRVEMMKKKHVSFPFLSNTSFSIVR
jgi:hypothetical protein